MKIENPITLAIDALKFDEFGAYEVTEVLAEDELDIISGGAIVGVDVETNNCNKGCTNNGCGKNNPDPNRYCGEDDDSYI